MKTKTQREGFHTVTPYLMTPEVDDLVAFIKKAFDGVETFRTTGQGGGQHVEVRIGDSMVMIGGASGGASMPAMLHLYVEDIDDVYQHALDAGATTIAMPADHDDGDRRGGVQDTFGNQWWMATHIGTGL